MPSSFGGPNIIDSDEEDCLEMARLCDEVTPVNALVIEAMVARMPMRMIDFIMVYGSDFNNESVGFNSAKRGMTASVVGFNTFDDR